PARLRHAFILGIVVKRVAVVGHLQEAILALDGTETLLAHGGVGGDGLAFIGEKRRPHLRAGVIAVAVVPAGLREKLFPLQRFANIERPALPIGEDRAVAAGVDDAHLGAVGCRLFLGK